MLYQNHNDETLVMLTLAGEQNAYEALVVRYEKAVLASAISVTRNQFMAEDAAQDAFVTAWMKLNTLKEPSKFGAWVCRIAKNCAANMVGRFRSFLPLEVLENFSINEEQNEDPAEVYARKEEKQQESEELQRSISMLPEKVRTVIRMHYFEGLSIVDIAEKMNASVGTVKWQLHDGRKRIRKELCAMNEKWNDTLTVRVMKKVEELKLWRLKNNKNGFEVIYKDVLKEVEELPESRDKDHALADVLLSGWWWIPGKKNDETFARIKAAAQASKNEEVMQFVLSREDSRVYGKSKIDFIREKQIPRLEAAGFVKALAHEWFWLAYEYFESGEKEKGYDAYKKVLSLLSPSDFYYAYTKAAMTARDKRYGEYADKDINNYLILSAVAELKIIDGTPLHYNRNWLSLGNLYSADVDNDVILKNAAYCDGNFTLSSLSVGETHIGSDESELTFVSDCESVSTPAGIFDGCELWIVKNKGTTVKTYYKNGVGIVKQIRKSSGIPEVRLLKAYSIIGGRGLLPLATGNTWEYTMTHNPTHSEKFLRYGMSITVEYADDKKAIISQKAEYDRISHNENSWIDMVLQIRNEYFREVNGKDRVCDVSYPIERARALAKTRSEIAHTRAACSVAQRIMDTNPKFNPQYKAPGHWNFFNRSTVCVKDGTVTLDDRDSRFDFELKNTGVMGDAYYPILFNDIYGILKDATNCIWSDEWRIGAEPTVEFMLWERRPMKTKILCEESDPIETKAGRFADCIKLTLDISGFEDSSGLNYRGGRKVYYFAKGVGIVRFESEYAEGIKTAVYELTSYEGKGEGYMPVADGLFRRYDALGLTDGFVASTEYIYADDGSGDGSILIFADRAGIREISSPITQYAAIAGEAEEDRLWDAGKHEESRSRHAVNNFHILTHFLGRDSRYWKAPLNAVAWNKHRLRTVEALSEGGDIPPAWYGFYALTEFRTACALFGSKNKEEGYEYLERALKSIKKCSSQKKGDLLDVGDALVYGGIKVALGKEYILLPDGTKETLSYDHLFDCGIDDMYYGLTAKRGWEWFNSVRDEERFKEYIDRVRSVMDDEGK